MSGSDSPVDGLFASERFGAVMVELEGLAQRFAAAGHRLFLVGGTVRDLVATTADPDAAHLDASDPDDFDLDATTSAHPEEIKRLLQGWADAIWTQGERFGTIGAMKRVAGSEVAGSEVAGRVFEITTHRSEAYQGGSRKPDVAFSDDIGADLSRRDFTVNAMAIDVTSPAPALVDPFHGADDLANRVLRTPLTPAESFSDDPLRMLRAARFITRYDLVPVPELVDAVRTMGDRLAIVSAERIRDELDKLLGAPSPLAGLQFVTDTGLARHAVPQFGALADRTVEASVHPDALSHAIALASSVPVGDHTVGHARRLTRWAALLGSLGAESARHSMRRLRDSIAHIDAIGTLVAVHERLVTHAGEAPASGPSWTDGEVRRMVRDAGSLLGEALVMARATATLLRTETSVRLTVGLDAFEVRIGVLAATEDLGDLQPELDGVSVMAVLGLAPGREVGAALGFLADLRLDAGVLGTAEATRRLQQWWADRSR